METKKSSIVGSIFPILELTLSKISPGKNTAAIRKREPLSSSDRFVADADRNCKSHSDRQAIASAFTTLQHPAEQRQSFYHE
jgi:hypothetical protein